MFERTRVRLRMHVLPGALSNVEGALRSQLNQSILKYVPALEGVPLAFTSLRALKAHARIQDELPDLHMPVEVVVLLFRPKVGTVLEGIVTRSSRDVVSVLVLSVFTASIRLGGASGGAHAREGDRVRFSVSGVGVASDLITLAGIELVVVAHADGGASRSISRSKSHKRGAERGTCAEPATHDAHAAKRRKRIEKSRA